MRFYGGSPNFWRREVSATDARRCLAAMPRLRAIESILAATRVAVGSGRLRKGAARAIGQHWERQANGGRRRPRTRKPVDPAALRALGIAVRKEPS